MTVEVVLPEIGAVAAWRAEARRLAGQGVPAEEVVWRQGDAAADLFAGAGVPQRPGREIRAPKEAIDRIERALYHKDPERFAWGYAMILRLSARATRWPDRSDLMQRRLMAMAKRVDREVHKMHAFVRFREVEGAGPRRRFGAWFEPEHPVTEAAVPFFARRFGDMDWVIATPQMTARFEDGALSFHPPDGTRPPDADATEDLWRTYYASIFNPARVMISAMQSEMPRKYWRNLPEAQLIPDLIRGAEARVREMRAAEERPASPALMRRAEAARAMVAARQPAPERLDTLEDARAAAQGCTRCPLHSDATQVVWGQGPSDAALMIVGEQPGDQEDLAGTPFVGPAGQVLRAAMAEAEVAAEKVWLTNAVKHFKFRPTGKRRLHQRPNAGEIDHCRFWLDREIALVRPRVILGLGASAARALTGDGTNLADRRGKPQVAPDGTVVILSVHPAYILRLPDPDVAAKARAALTQDLALARDKAFC